MQKSLGLQAWEILEWQQQSLLGHPGGSLEDYDAQGNMDNSFSSESELFWELDWRPFMLNLGKKSEFILSVSWELV